MILSALHGFALQAEKSVKIFRYQFDGYAYSSPYEDKIIDVYVNNTMAWPSLGLEKGETFLLPEDVVSSLSFDQKYAIYENDGKKQGIFVGSRFTDEEETQRKLYVIDSSNSKLLHIAPGLSSFDASYTSGQLFHFNHDYFIAYDDDFKPLWRCNVPDESFNPADELNKREVIAHNDTVIANFFVDPKNNYAGSIYCWDKATGDVRWTQGFEANVQSLRRYNEQQLLAVIGGKLVVIDANNGQIEQQLETGLRNSLDKKALSFYKEIIVLHSIKDNKIQFYQRDTFERLREIDCSEYGFSLFKFPSILIDNHLFLPCMHNSNQFWQHCGSMLMIDLDDIYSDIDVELGPDFTIQEPDASNGAIRLSVHHSDWGDIVRFAERHMIEQVYKHGKSWLFPQSNKHFNGELQLVVSGCSSPELEEKLSVWEKRVLFIIDSHDLHDKAVSLSWAIDNE